MGKQRLTDTTKGPAARFATIVGLVAAAVALIMTIAMVIVALGGYSTSVLRMCLLIWVLSLFLVFGVTHYLKSVAANQAPLDEGTDSGQ